MSALSRFLPLFTRHRGAFLAALSLSLITLAAGIGLLAVSGWFLTAAFLAGAAASFNLFGPSAAVRGLSFLRIAARYGERLSGHDATLKLLTDIRAWLFARLLPRAGPVGSGLKRGELVARLTADVDTLDVVFLLAFGPMLTALVAGLGMTVILAFLLPLAAPGFALAFLAAALGVPLLLVRATRRAGAAAVEAAGALRGEALDGAAGRTDILALGAQDRFFAGLDGAAQALARARLSIGRRAALAQAGVHILTGAALVAVLVPGILAVSAGQLGGPALAGLLLATIGSFEATATITRSVSRLGAAAAAAQRLSDIADAPLSRKLPGRLTAVPSGALRLEGLCVGHAGRAALGPVTLTVPPAALVAVKGPSGSGKSTLLLSILALLPPLEGRVTIGGVDIAELSANTLYGTVALLEQDAPVFIGTIRDNLVLAAPQAPDDALWQALERARLDQLVRSLPGGLDAPVGEAGHTLSTGEGRRLALARILLTPARILLLDEPTSGLDGQAEDAFLRDLRRACAGRTVVLATHAELPAHAVDAVWTLRDGRLDAEAMDR